MHRAWQAIPPRHRMLVLACGLCLLATGSAHASSLDGDWFILTGRNTVSAFYVRQHVRYSQEELDKRASNVCRVGKSDGGGLSSVEPARARRIAEKLEWHYALKRGSWLNTAEVELAALARQCLGRRIGSVKELRRQVAAWQLERNEASVRWRLRTRRICACAPNRWARGIAY